MTRTDNLVVWMLRAAWVTLPVTVGGTFADATTDWSDPTSVVFAILAWTAWGGALVAILAPRPAGLTAVRIVAPLLFVTTAAAGAEVGAGGAPAVVVAGATAVLALSSAFATAAANGASYGDEVRFPLRVPPALFLGPLPVAIAAVGAGIAAGPLLLSVRQWIWGTAAVVVGLPLAAVGVRALHGLSRRWAVLVPAGFVLADPATLDDPVLFRRERISALRPVASRPEPDPPRADEIDLRLGAQRGSCVLMLGEETDALHVRRGRRRSEQVKQRAVRFAVTRRFTLLARAAARRIPVVDQAATPPPTNRSPE